MRTGILVFAALFISFAAPRPAVAEAEIPAPAADATMPAMSGGDTPATGQLRLAEVAATEPVLADDAIVAQWPERGSFWWVVGAIVVGGVILSLLL